MKSVGFTPLAAAIGLVALLGACTDSPIAPPRSGVAPSTLSASRSGSLKLFERYVAIGTSISMGVQSDGVFKGSQETSWPARLARLAGHEITQPYISSFGCGAPLAGASGPVVGLVPNGFRRTSGEPLAGVPTQDRFCGELEAGVTLPTANVAVDGATTLDALSTMPKEVPVSLRERQYARVLPAGHTQVSAMLAQNPKLVSVELGGNDVIGARDGVASRVTPIELWKDQYRQVLDAVQQTAKRAVLVGLVDDALKFPGFRTGRELWLARATLVPFGVIVGGDCEVTNADNVLFVPAVIPTAIATARATGAPATLSCADQSTTRADFVLTGAEIAGLNAQVNEMNAFIRSEAEARGFAYFDLEVVYGRADSKPAFNGVTLLMTGQPYGPYTSLDGIHPNAEGARLIADAAAAALNAKYRLGIGEMLAVMLDDDQ